MSTYKVQLTEGRSIIVDSLNEHTALALGITFIMLSRPGKDSDVRMPPTVTPALHDDVRNAQTFGRAKIITHADLVKLSEIVNESKDGSFGGDTILSEIMKLPVLKND